MPTSETAALAAELLGLERKRQQGALSVEETTRHRELQAQLLAQRGPHERRAHPRIPAELEARLSLEQTVIVCRASEFSLGGLSLRGQLWIDAGTELVLDNLRAGTRDYPMVIRSRVVWKGAENSTPPRAGLEFIAPDENGKRQLSVFFEWLLLRYLEQLAREG